MQLCLDEWNAKDYDDTKNISDKNLFLHKIFELKI